MEKQISKNNKEHHKKEEQWGSEGRKLAMTLLEHVMKTLELRKYSYQYINCHRTIFKNPEMDPIVDTKLIYNKSSISHHWVKDGLFNNCIGLTGHMEKIKLDSSLASYSRKYSSRWIRYLNV